jgi:hypothetical protein
LASSSPTPSEWLGSAARRLGAADPRRYLGVALAEAFPWQLGAAAYEANSLLPGATPLELSFSEQSPQALRLDFEPRSGSWSTPTLAASFGPRLAAEFEARAGSVRTSAPDVGFGVFLGAVFDASSLLEAKVYYPLGPTGADGEPGSLVAAAKEELPDLAELMHAVAVSRDGISERVYLVHRNELELLALEPLLARFGPAHRLPELALTLMRLSDGSLVLPPSSLVVGLRARRRSVELKVELMLPGLGLTDAHSTVAALLAERPDSRVAFDRWWRALEVPGTRPEISVVSARIAAAQGVRLTVYAHPVVASPEDAAERETRLDPVLG